MTEETSSNVGDHESSGPQAAANTPRVRYWDGRFVMLTALLVVIAASAAYLEYFVYPQIMTQTFSESNPSLILSFLTFKWDAAQCTDRCRTIHGVPSLDFFQIFVVALILVNISHYLGYRKANML